VRGPFHGLALIEGFERRYCLQYISEIVKNTRTLNAEAKPEGSSSKFEVEDPQDQLSARQT
jgi:hypothetical protein